MIKNEMTVASVFSGAGGLDLGFHQENYKLIFANDIDEDACTTFRDNIGNIVQGTFEAIKATLTNLRGVDVFVGGPPCQGFSVAGKMDPNDERSKLSFEFMNTLDKIQPKIFVFENVKSLATNKRWSDVFGQLLRSAEQAGYELDYRIVKARDYGVPQLRERLFIVGFNKSYFKNASIVRENYSNNLNSQQISAPSPRAILSKIGKAGTTENPVTSVAKITYAKTPVMRRSPFSGMLFNGTGRPVNPDYFFPTLSATMGGNRTPIIDESLIYEKQSCL
eukprot:TRINITY_DN12625_c0_g1_i2.p1 TRINITY_DN12625_c0_g1~~TRINITY_DN12625_c0_g1_i2.p1  ORF type:complete len:278 (-),score=23.82 TRINITY_DN12625_c0_g1_i2:79-912(-)